MKKNDNAIRCRKCSTVMLAQDKELSVGIYLTQIFCDNDKCDLYKLLVLDET